jgi:hypothetical protein
MGSSEETQIESRAYPYEAMTEALGAPRSRKGTNNAL